MNKIFQIKDDRLIMTPNGPTGSIGVSCNIGGININSASYSNTSNALLNKHISQGITGILGPIGIAGATGQPGDITICSSCKTPLTSFDYAKSLQLQKEGIPLNKIPEWSKDKKYILDTKEEFYNMAYMCSRCKRELTLNTIIGPQI